MSLRDDLGLITPRLRRYARALSHAAPIPGETADALVQRTLTHAVQTGPLSPRSDMTVWLYSLLTQFHRDAENRMRGAAAAAETQSFYGNSIGETPIGHAHPVTDGLAAGLASLSLEEREALLLVVLESFSYSQASHILRISRGVLIARLAQARAALANAIGQKPGALPGRPSYLRLVK